MGYRRYVDTVGKYVFPHDLIIIRREKKKKVATSHIYSTYNNIVYVYYVLCFTILVRVVVVPWALFLLLVSFYGEVWG